MSIRVERLRQLREQHGWSQRELSRLCGIGDLQIHRYEMGITDPSTDSLKVLAETLKVSSDYLLGLADEPRGHLGDGSITEDERAMLDAYRTEGWRGVMRLGVERIP